MTQAHLDIAVITHQLQLASIEVKGILASVDAKHNVPSARLEALSNEVEQLQTRLSTIPFDAFERVEKPAEPETHE